MNGEDAGRVQPAPVHVGGRQTGWPVVGVHQLGRPANAGRTGGDFRSGQSEASETHRIVRPVVAIGVTVWRAFALIEFRADQHIDDQAVGHVHPADAAAGNLGIAAQRADRADGVTAVDYLRIAGDQHAHIVACAQCPGQCRRHVGEPAGLDQIGQLGGDEQNLAFVIVATTNLQGRASNQGYGGFRLRQSDRQGVHSGNTHHDLPRAPAFQVPAPATSIFLLCNDLMTVTYHEHDQAEI